MNRDQVTHAIIGAAIAVHRRTGPGLLESAYQSCLATEFTDRGIRFLPQYPIRVVYKGIEVECGYRADFLVEGRVILELKAVDAIHPIHIAQVITYLKLAGCTVGLLINFNVHLLRDGVRRISIGPSGPSVSSVSSEVEGRS